MEIPSSNILKTNYLKGLAISTIIIYHYLKFFVFPHGTLQYITDSGWWGFGIGAVSIFFVLSGYGIYHSLQKRDIGWDIKKIGAFFYRRFFRIFPIFWIVIISDILVFKTNYSWHAFLGFTQMLDRGYWFVGAIIICYLASIFIFYLLNKLNLKTYYAVIFLGFVAANFVYFNFSLNQNAPLQDNYVYRSLFLSTVLLFAVGLSIPKVISLYKNRFQNKFAVITFLSLFFVMIFVTGLDFDFITQRIVTIIFLTVTCLMTISFIASDIKLPLKKEFSFLGKYSYSLYLTHFLFFSALVNLDIINSNSYESVFYTLALLPALFGACYIIENLFSFDLKRIKEIKTQFTKFYKKNPQIFVLIIAVMIATVSLNIFYGKNQEDSWFSKATTLEEEGRFEEAINAYENAIKQNPNFIEAWINMGNLYSYLTQYEDALYCFNQAINIDQYHAGAWSNKGTVLMLLNRFNESLDAINTAILLMPDNAGFWYNKGIVLSNLGRTEEAAIAFNKAYDLDPSLKIPD